MATNTTNLNLVKPAYSDTADIGDINDNMDIIDQAYGTMSSNMVNKTDRVAIDRNVSGSLADCDNATETGFYRIINTTENRPFSYGILFNMMSNTYITQIAISVGTDKGDMYCRGYGGGAWSAWKKCN